MINNYVYFILQWNLDTQSCNIQGAIKILPYVQGGLIDMVVSNFITGLF